MPAKITPHSIKRADAVREKGAERPRRILVVESDPSIRHLKTDVLRRSGYHADAAKDGAAAWDTLQRSRYDLLVTDNDMPNVTGVELLKMLRASNITLPVIMASGTLPLAEFARPPFIRPDAFLLKPYSFQDLLGTVHKLLRGNNGARDQVAP